MAKVIGTHKFKVNLDKIASRNLPKAYSSAMTAITLSIKGDSQKRAPVDTGFLKSSAYANILKVDKNGTTGIVGYTANYATYVHEQTWKKHTVGEAKFLENAVKNISSKFTEIFGLYIKKIGMK